MSPKKEPEIQKTLQPHRVNAQNQQLTTNTGVKIDDTDNSLTAGARGPTLLEDFHFREKLTHFDHERILNGLCMPVAQVRMATSKFTSPWQNTLKPNSSKTPTRKPQFLSASPPWRAHEVQLTLSVTCVDLPHASTPKTATMI